VNKALVAFALLLASNVSAASLDVARLPSPPSDLTALSAHVGGRVMADGQGGVIQQWPGVYVEAAFEGSEVYVRVGENHAIFHLRVDDADTATLTSPEPGLYVVKGLAKGAHRVRMEVATESQSGVNRFGGFWLAKGASALPPPVRARQIEFIGDSHTVGYGNTLSRLSCTQDEIWASTDTTVAYGPLIARHYDADYQVNAISGRGVVRNYDGFAADTLPQAYPFAVFDKSGKPADDAWNPAVVVMSLGTNDFSTPLHAGEKWTSREQLHEDVEATYVAFIQRLRQSHPKAMFILWSTDNVDGEVAAEARKVVAKLKALGESRIAFVPVNGLAMSACDAHPSAADDAVIAGAIGHYIDANAVAW